VDSRQEQEPARRALGWSAAHLRTIILAGAAVCSATVVAQAQTPSLSITDGSVTEGSFGTSSLTLSVSLATTSPTPAPMPVISRGVPVWASASSYAPTNANDASYDTQWRSSGDMPVWIAYDLSGVPAEQRGRVVILWSNGGFFVTPDFTGDRYNCPASYTIDAHAAAGGGAPPAEGDPGWVTLATVTGPNPYGARQHDVNLTSGATVYNWIRMRVTEVHGSMWNWDVSINLDVHDAHLGLEDDWLFLGDSITAGAMGPDETVNQNGEATGPNFPQLIHDAIPERFPAAQNGGIGGWSTWDAVVYFDQWLADFPGHYVAISFGTNDAGWLGEFGDYDIFYNNYEEMVQKVIAAGKVPVVPTIPWLRTPTAAWVPQLNARLALLKTNYPQIVSGPDLWTYFSTHQDLISDDNIHPTAEGFVIYRQLWADAMLAAVYQ
jgi:lysophospholipase L1-like esterase